MNVCVSMYIYSYMNDYVCFIFTILYGMYIFVLYVCMYINMYLLVLVSNFNNSHVRNISTSIRCVMKWNRSFWTYGVEVMDFLFESNCIISITLLFAHGCYSTPGSTVRARKPNS